MSQSIYETFRTVLTMNLCTVLQDSGTLHKVLEMVDITMHDFELSKKPLEIIPATGTPEVVKSAFNKLTLHLASFSIEFHLQSGVAVL